MIVFNADSGQAAVAGSPSSDLWIRSPADIPGSDLCVGYHDRISGEDKNSLEEGYSFVHQSYGSHAPITTRFEVSDSREA